MNRWINKKVGLIGSPVYHSKSPNIYTKMFLKEKINGSFTVLDISPDDLRRIKEIICTHRLDCFAVTMPHKQNIIKYCDYLSEESKFLHSVNFIKVDYGNENNCSFTGYSTDGDGFVISIKEREINLKNKKVLIYGIGGAAASITYSLKREGAIVTASARNIDKLKTFADHFNVLYSCGLNLNNFDIFINATPLGMTRNEQFSTFDFLLTANRDLFVYDLIYFPEETQLIINAKELGLSCCNGNSMLYNQAKLAFSILMKN